MSKKPAKNTVLERQHEEGNPLLDILKGAVANLENAKSCLISLNPEQQAATLGSVSTFLHTLHEVGVAELLIVKIQAPLSSNVENPGYLIYNEDRSLMDQVVLEDPAIIEWFSGDPKMYVEARLWIDGTLQLMRRVEEQDW